MKGSKTGLLKVLLFAHLVLAGSLMQIDTSFAAKGNHGRSGSTSGIDQAVARIQQQTGGRVLRVSQENSFYIIKVLMPSGVVKTFRVRADK